MLGLGSELHDLIVGDHAGRFGRVMVAMVRVRVMMRVLVGRLLDAAAAAAAVWSM